MAAPQHRRQARSSRSKSAQWRRAQSSMQQATEMTSSSKHVPNVAFYYPGPYWRSSDWVKNLLLFFDGVALLVPDYLRSKTQHVLEPHLFEPLLDRKLLHILEPETFVDADAARRLHEGIVGILDSGKLEAVLQSKDSAFHEISYSRMGGFGDPELAGDLLRRLTELGLARRSQDGVSIPMHGFVRQLFLALLSQILRPQGRVRGLELHPATDRSVLVDALSELIGQVAPAATAVVASDLETVGADLSKVPLDELLSYRTEHQVEYKRYTRSVRSFVRDLSVLSADERAVVEEDRRSEIQDIAADLKRRGRVAWKRPASFALGAAGAAWTAATGDPIGAILGGGAALLSDGAAEGETGVYSFLFRATRELEY